MPWMWCWQEARTCGRIFGKRAERAVSRETYHLHRGGIERGCQAADEGTGRGRALVARALGHRVDQGAAHDDAVGKLRDLSGLLGSRDAEADGHRFVGAG